MLDAYRGTPIALGLPEPHRVVSSAREDRLAVGAECTGFDGTLVRYRHAEDHPRAGIPEPCRLVHTPGEDDPAVAIERSDPHRPMVEQRRPEGGLRGGVPELGIAVITPGQQGHLPEGLKLTHITGS